MKIWSISQNYEFKLEKILQGHQRWVWDCAFSADSAYLVTGTSRCRRSLSRQGQLIARSVFGSHCPPLEDGLWRDCAAIQWASQRLWVLSHRRQPKLTYSALCQLRSAARCMTELANMVSFIRMNCLLSGELRSPTWSSSPSQSVSSPVLSHAPACLFIFLLTPASEVQEEVIPLNRTLLDCTSLRCMDNDFLIFWELISGARV